MIAVITQRQQVKMAFDKIKVTNPIVEMDGLFSPIFFFFFFFFTFFAWDDI
jgi:hypothetical protein